VETDAALIDALARSAYQVVGVLTRVAAEHDLSLTQLRVVAILRDRDRLRMSTLAAHLGLDRSTLSGLVARAEARGLLQRTADAGDGRAIDVALTPDGHAIAERGAAAVRTALEPQIESLSGRERETLARLLEQTL
jgi:DNA-binding MarR family transcriptional regulator